MPMCSFSPKTISCLINLNSKKLTTELAVVAETSQQPGHIDMPMLDVQDPLSTGGGRERAHAPAYVPADEAARAPIPVLRHRCTGVLGSM